MNQPTWTSPTFGDLESENAYRARVDDARARQATPFAVAPDCSLTLPTGRTYRAGEAVELDDIIPWFSRLLDHGVIVRWSADRVPESRTPRPDASHHVVKPMTYRGRVLHPGEGVNASDFARPGRPERVIPAAPALRNIHGAIVRGSREEHHLKAVPASDGTAELERLEGLGVLAPITHAEGALEKAPRKGKR